MSNSSDQSLYRWIKASERLPEKEANAKMNGTLGLLLNFGNFLEFSGRGFFHSYTYKSQSLKEIEWLEKVEADQQELWGQLSETWKELTDHDMSKRSHSFDILKYRWTLIPKQ